MTVSKLGDKPARVDFNLDTLDMEGSVAPFVFVAGGHRFTVDSIEDHDWQELMAFEGADFASTLKLMLGMEQYVIFTEIKGVSVRKIKPLLDAIQAHFGLPDTPEGDASSGS